MKNIKTESLSIRVPSDLKTDFTNLFNQSSLKSKSEFLKRLLDEFNENKSKPFEEKLSEEIQKDSEAKSEDQNITGTKPDNNLESIDEILQEVEIQEETSAEKLEILIKVNPVQAFAIRETILNEGFTEEVNKLVNKVDNARDTSFFGNDLYSGAFKGVFSPMDLDETNEESIKKNMGIALVNHFMSSIVIGTGDMYTPVTKSIIKEFLKEEPDKD